MEPRQLYDMAPDIRETSNVATANPEVVQQLTAKMNALISAGRSSPGAEQKNDTAVKSFE